MGIPLWTFEGYQTEAGGHPVQEWYHAALAVDERDLIRTRVNYLKDLERHLWKLPCFGPAGDEIWEIRRDTPSGWIRIYGTFSPTKRRCFLLLNGNDKNVKNDTKAKKLANDRLKNLRQGKGCTHEFDFEERSPGANQAK